MDLIEQVRAFRPFNEQEARDQAVLLQMLSSGAPIFQRADLAHLSASAWIVNRDRTKVLLAYHNIYKAWSWLGGHADGEKDLAQTALREAREESGLREVRLLSPDIFSIEILTVDGHEKRGKYVSSHLHLNVTYLLEASDQDALTVKADENAAVSWFDLAKAPAASSESWMRTRIYEKLNQKLLSNASFARGT